MSDVIATAKALAARGMRPVPVNGKAPCLRDWQNAVLSPEVVEKLFAQHPGAGVGLVLDGLVDLEADDPVADAALARLAPPTPWRWRSPTGRRHHVFRCAGAKHGTWSRPGGGPLVELRTGAHQSVIPPSPYPNGGRYEWLVPVGPDGLPTEPPAEVDEATLRRVASLAAVAGLVAQAWRDGNRHQLALALAGFLRRRGVSEAETQHVVAAIAERTGDDELPDRLSAVRDTFARADGEPVTGLPTLAELLGNDAVGLLERWLPAQERAHARLACEPAPVSWPDPPDEAAFYGLAGDVVRVIEPHSEADPVALLIQFLAAFGCVIGRRPHFIVEADRHGFNLFAVLVGVTSKARKGSSWGQIEAIFRHVDPDWVETRVLGGLSSGEGLIWAVRDEITRTERDRKTGETVEVVVDRGVDDKRLLVREAEFGSVLRVVNRETNTLSAILRCAWETGNLQALVKNTKTRATGAHIAIVGHVTKDELLRHLDTTEVAGGLGNRFLWLCVRRSKCLPEGGRVPERELSEIAACVAEAVVFARGVDELRRDEEARAIWREVYPDLSEGKPGLLGAMIARAEAQVLRLAGLYALLDCSRVIRAEHLAAALALWQYCEASARFIFGDALGDPLADELLRELRRRPGGMTRTEISNFFGRNENAAAIAGALRTLAEHGLARLLSEPTRGRPAERWVATA